MSGTVDIRAIEVGQELTPVVHFTSTAQLVRYAGAANDYSGIHYDLEYARERGFPHVIVHGFLKASFLAELACEWAGAGSWLRRFSARYHGIDVVGAPIVCRGRVTAVWPEERALSLELWTENAEGVRTTAATGHLQLGDEDIT
jgi:acyl dehydratase